ncbi:MAG TPA: ERAP1-like C-terminal domain-containing protein, partial [Pseudonocardiaceae bacterium]|nr:ERAP1-like C-terminal domain-containing protein [Pseudonocardiaceae bacterium]
APFAGALGGLGTYFAASADRELLAGVADELLAGAQPGSNRQLIAVRAVIDVSPDSQRLLRWLEGDVPKGVLVDDDLRWRLLIALCAAGVKGDVDVDAERQRDLSSQGALHALRCRASIPTAEAKASVWHSIVSDASLSNSELYALAERFFHRDQTDLTEKYTRRYFDEIPATAAFRTGWMVERTALLVYPRYAVSDATVALAQRCLTRADLDPGVRRSISDRTDDLRRVLRSRVTFGS